MTFPWVSDMPPSQGRSNDKISRHWISILPGTLLQGGGISTPPQSSSQVTLAPTLMDGGIKSGTPLKDEGKDN